MSLQEPTRKVPKHLIDPATLQPGAARQRPEQRQRDLVKLARVKQWVTSALVLTTMFHLSVGLMIAAYYTDEARTDARIGLNVIAGILWVAGIAGARAIHKLNPVSLWLVAGLALPALGMYLTLR
ncbi:MAG: hypothetical protein NTV23_10770 [Propionibacteriales bacterium]|nr:hypothetical protein [Propionibacteriales bacterium]